MALKRSRDRETDPEKADDMLRSHADLEPGAQSGNDYRAKRGLYSNGRKDD